MKNLIFVFFAIALATNAHAGGGGGMSNIVYDPTNHAENLVTAARSVQAEAQRAQQIYNQILHYRETLLQNQTTNPTVLASLLNETTQDMKSTQTYIGVLGRLLNETNQQRNMVNNRIIDVKQSGLGFDEYAQREKERIAAGDRYRTQLMEQERAIMNSVNNDAKFVQEMQGKIPTSVGIHDSARDMNTMLNRIVAQNAALIQLQAASNAVSQEDAAATKQRREDLQRAVGTASTKEREWMRGEIDRLNGTTAAPQKSSAAPTPLTPAQKRALGL